MTGPITPDGMRLELAQLRHLEVASVVEATTLVLLVGIAVPLKHLAAQPLGVTIMGPVHGIAFCLYIWMAVQTIAGGGWSKREGLRLVLSALLPFAGYTTLFLTRRKAAALRTDRVALS